MVTTTQPVIRSVVSLWRYPVKSMMGEELNAVAVTERGLLLASSLLIVDRLRVKRPRGTTAKGAHLALEIRAKQPVVKVRK